MFIVCKCCDVDYATQRRRLWMNMQHCASSHWPSTSAASDRSVNTREWSCWYEGLAHQILMYRRIVFK